MDSLFDMSMFQTLKHFLGMQIYQIKDGIYLSQGIYIKNLLDKFGILSSKPFSTLLDKRHGLCKNDNEERVEKGMFRSIIESLMYATPIRPEFTFAVSIINRFRAIPQSITTRKLKNHEIPKRYH